MIKTTSIINNRIINNSSNSNITNGPIVHIINTVSTNYKDVKDEYYNMSMEIKKSVSKINKIKGCIVTLNNEVMKSTKIVDTRVKYASLKITNI